MPSRPSTPQRRANGERTTQAGRTRDVAETVPEGRRRVAVLLWVADGSEILDWDLDLSPKIAWATSVGFSNVDADPDTPIGTKVQVYGEY